jgi:hypothetical protein
MTNLTIRNQTEDNSDFVADAFDKLLIALTGVLAMITILAVA